MPQWPEVERSGADVISANDSERDLGEGRMRLAIPRCKGRAALVRKGPLRDRKKGQTCDRRGGVDMPRKNAKLLIRKVQVESPVTRLWSFSFYAHEIRVIYLGFLECIGARELRDVQRHSSPYADFLCATQIAYECPLDVARVKCG